MRAWIAILLAAVAGGQTTNETPEVYRIGNGVSAPKLIHKVEPEFSAQGRDAHVQGTVLCEMIVTAQGTPAEISVLSPLGFGMDEKAIEAIQRWRFKPAMKDGRPVAIRAIVEVHFRFAGEAFDEGAERKRMQFNIAMQRLAKGNDTDEAKHVETILKLSRGNFPAAMYVESTWLSSGAKGTKDPARSLELLQKSAKKDYGPAMFALGRRLLDGRDAPADPEKGKAMIRDAALLGSAQAQYFLASRHENGIGMPVDFERARTFYRLCATSGEPMCQARLGRLILVKRGRQEHELVQAIAWLELAADRGIGEARELLETERAKLTDPQKAEAMNLKSRLAPRR